MNLRSSLAALLLSAAAVAATGCQPAQIGAAAVVDGRAISVADVQRTVKDIRAFQQRAGVATESPDLLAQRELLRRLVLEVHVRAARRLGVTVTPGDVSEALRDLQRQKGTEEGYDQFIAGLNLTPTIAPDRVRQDLLRQKMAAVIAPGAATPDEMAAADAKVVERLIATAKQMDVDVNPRFGDFDSSRGDLVPHQDDFLAPAAENQPGFVPGVPVPPGGQG